jgi:hypothetical protein
MGATQGRLEEAEKRMCEQSFRENKGLGNEVGYYIFDYPAADELVVREQIRYWGEKFAGASDGFNPAVFDLYDVMMDMLEREGLLEQCFAFEKKYGYDRIVTSVGRLLRLSDDAGVMTGYIKEHTPTGAVVLLTGVGKCYPVLRSHKVLNNLHQILDNVPVVMFYPGRYDGRELVLFGEVKDDNYYRAFRLVD